MIYSLRHPKRAQQDIDLIDTWPEFLKDLKEGLESRMPAFEKLMADGLKIPASIIATKPTNTVSEVLLNSTSGIHPVRHVKLPIIDKADWPMKSLYYMYPTK